ncbi:MAG TPA: HAMP domain-containing protein [Bacteroidetes bacterium]|nr:putative methyl-accepting chemotaxis protein YoaH [bacterium BMS3Bbin04]HDO66533.1 HAMP domain-containing protein [Bacteroidota bacterium]HEX05658.1 HAMP domain-containing protein [Bacteroidota bacterium]
MNRKLFKYNRALIVPNPVHGRLIRSISLILIILVLISGISFYLLAQKQLSDEYYKAHSQIQSTMEMLLPWMIAVYVVGLIATFFLSILYTRKLAGPLVRFDRELEQLSDGDYTRWIMLRHDDEFYDLAEKINTMSSATAERFRQISQCAGEVEQAAAKLKTFSESSPTDDRLKSSIGELNESSEKLQAALTDIRFEND